MKNLIRPQMFIALFLLTQIPAFAVADLKSSDLLNPVLHCPSIQPAINEALNELHRIKAKISKEAHCDGAHQAADQFEKTVASRRRQVAMGIVEGNEGKTLTSQQSRMVQSYARGVVQSGLGLISEITQASSCFRGERNTRQLLNSISSFVFEATEALAAVAGPYGVPLTAGSGLLRGVLEGFMNHRDSLGGYRFDSNDNMDTRAYVSSLCAYYSYRREVEQLLDPEGTLEALIELEEHLQTIEKKYRSHCQGCGSLIDEYREIIDNFLILDEEREPLIAELRDAAKVLDQELGNDFASESLDVAEKLRWINDERVRIRAESDDATSIGSALVLEVIKQMDDFIIHRSGREFLRWQTKESERVLKQYGEHVDNWTFPLLQSLFSSKVSTHWRAGIFPPVTSPYSWHSSYFSSAYEFMQKVKEVRVEAQLPERYSSDEYLDSSYGAGIIYLQQTKAYLNSISEYCAFFHVIGLHGRFLQQCQESRLLKKVLKRFKSEFYADPAHSDDPLLDMDQLVKEYKSHNVPWYLGLSDQLKAEQQTLDFVIENSFRD